MSLSIHCVRDVQVGDIRFLGKDSFNRVLDISTTDGEQLTLSLYGESENALRVLPTPDQDDPSFIEVDKNLQGRIDDWRAQVDRAVSELNKVSPGEDTRALVMSALYYATNKLAEQVEASA